MYGMKHNFCFLFNFLYEFVYFLIFLPTCASGIRRTKKTSAAADGGVRVNALASISDYDHWPPRQYQAGG